MRLAIPDVAGRVILAAARRRSCTSRAAISGPSHRPQGQRAENVLHLALGILLAGAIVRAFLFRGREAAFAILLFAIAGAADEFIFDRDLPAEEHDVHAKEHFALFIFVAVFGALLHLRATIGLLLFLSTTRTASPIAAIT